MLWSCLIDVSTFSESYSQQQQSTANSCQLGEYGLCSTVSPPMRRMFIQINVLSNKCSFNGWRINVPKSGLACVPVHDGARGFTGAGLRPGSEGQYSC